MLLLLFKYWLSFLVRRLAGDVKMLKKIFNGITIKTFRSGHFNDDSTMYVLQLISIDRRLYIEISFSIDDHPYNNIEVWRINYVTGENLPLSNNPVVWLENTVGKKHT